MAKQNAEKPEAKVEWTTAKFIRTLVFYDQPQVVQLRKGKSNFIAVGVPDENGMMFLAVSVRAGDWELYQNDRVDLHYLFRPNEKRMAYYFDLLTMKGDEVRMRKHVGMIPESHLPGPRLFASDHTEDSNQVETPSGIETLYLDGSWDLPELSGFQQKFSDVYTFVFTVEDWKKRKSNVSARDKIQKAFTDKPFRGGSSYGSYFDDLEAQLDISERLRLKSIEKASPGNMKVAGVQSFLDTVAVLIENYVANRPTLKQKYTALHEYLQKQSLLRASVRSFDYSDLRRPFIENSARELATDLGLDCFDEIEEITKKNALGSAKIVLALFRRIKGTADFFVQGRASFSR